MNGKSRDTNCLTCCCDGRTLRFSRCQCGEGKRTREEKHFQYQRSHLKGVQQVDKIYVYMTGRSAHEKAPCRLRARYFLQEKVEANVRHIVRGRKISISDAIVRLHRARLSAVSVPSNRAFKGKGKGEEISPWSDNGSSPPRPPETRSAATPHVFFSFSTSSRIIFHFF